MRGPTAPPARCRTANGRERTAAQWGLSSLAAIVLAVTPSWASAQRVRVSNLADVDFGLISDPQAEARRSQSLCLYNNGGNGTYSVSASGSGAGSAFVLNSGAHSLPYRVEWSDKSGQSSGVALAPAVPLTGQTSSARNQSCSTGPATSASLAIVLQATELSQAREGSYNGTLTLLIAAE